uniref:Nucleoporin 160 n=1 Tax=Echeneis naucrates TaxID=173247 RepID=A0A665UIY1_ECHNA
MAAVLERSFIEICGFERETLQRFREVAVDLGVSSLPGGLKFPDTAGAFHYEDSGKLLSVTSNRFIHWSTSGDTVQLVEQSLDTNLLNNTVKLRFVHCTVLPGGVTVQETLNNVIILISTNQSVHRLVLPHPNRMYRSELVTELHMQSIFTDVGKLSLQDPSHSAIIPTSAGQTGSPSTSAAWLSYQGEAHYALASPTGGIMVVTLPPHDTLGGVSVVELKRSSMIQKLSGWMPTAIRGEQSPADLALSLAVRELEEDSFIFALCQDHRLRMWSLREQACLLEADVMEFMPACRGVKRLSGQGHRLRLAFSSTTGLCLAVYLAVPQKGQFTVLQLATSDNNRYSLEHISTLFTTQETLVDFHLTSTDIWALWVDDSNTTVVKYINFEHNTAGQWNQVFVQPPPEEEVHVGMDQDPRETYLDVLFSPVRFTALAIVKALQIFHRGGEKISDLSWELLKREVTVAVETELQSSVTEFEFSQEEYRQLQMEFWSKFYGCCLQYQESLSTPLGLTVSSLTGLVCLLKKGLVSFLLPCFAVDHLYLSCDEYLLSEEETPITEDLDLGRDVLQLVQCLRLVSDAVSGEMAYEMEKALEHLQSPERAAELALESMLSNDSDNVIENIQNKLQDVRNPVGAMMVLLRELDLETDPEVPEGALVPGRSLNLRISLSQLLGSSSAVSVVCQAVSHMTMTRALFCRDLLILQKLYLRFGDNVFLGGGAQLLQLQQDLIPRSAHLLASYHLLKHISQSLTSSVPMDTICLCLCAVLSPQTVLELFYQTSARRIIVSQFFSQQHSSSLLVWSHMISTVVTLLAQLLYPSEQPNPIGQIVGYSLVNIGSCRFMLGQCYLANGEGQKVSKDPDVITCMAESMNM